MPSLTLETKTIGIMVPVYIFLFFKSWLTLNTIQPLHKLLPETSFNTFGLVAAFKTEMAHQVNNLTSRPD